MTGHLLRVAIVPKAAEAAAQVMSIPSSSFLFLFLSVKRGGSVERGVYTCV